MAQVAQQFDPIEQLAASLNSFEMNIAELNAMLPRMEFARERIARELEAVRERRDRLDYYTEERAAAVLTVKETHLASLRRQHNLPHVRLGGEIRYTRQHLDQITEFFDSRNAGKSQQLRRAA